MKGACLLHIVLISSIRLLTVMNTPSLNTLARNPLIQCLQHRVPTPVFLDNPQSLPDPRFSFWISPPAPAHSGCVNEPHTSLPAAFSWLQTTQNSTSVFLHTWFCFYHSCCHLKDLLSNQFIASFWVSPWQATPHCYSITGKNLAENASNLNEAWDQRLVPGSPGTARTIPARSPVQYCP